LEQWRVFGDRRQVALQKSEQSHKSTASHRRSGDTREMAIAGLNERIYASTKLAALYDVLAAQGHSAGDILKHLNLQMEEVHSPNARISLEQLTVACKNAVQLSSDRHLPYRVGTSIHISTYGMYGFAILCCPDFRKAMNFAARYHMLAAPLSTIDFDEGNGFASWTNEPNLDTAIDPRLYRFITEMQIGIHISLMRDIMGSLFAPYEICLAYAEAGDFCLPADQLGCSLRFTRPANQIVFKSTWLDQGAILGNKTTYPTIVALCDDLLDDLKLRIGVAGKIRALLLRDIANPPNFAAVAKIFGANERSLRRELRQQDLSFRGLLDELRTQIALKYLRTTKFTNEDIALALGFSDATNFRRAFHRWTNKSPSEIRAK
jgi:AraC-like DNA-binding protein